MLYANSSIVRIVYESKRLTAGLTDVIIDIWNPNGTKILANEPMLELGEGIYYYDYTVNILGSYVFKCNSPSNERILIDKVDVVSTIGGGGWGIDGSFAAMVKDLKVIRDNIASKNFIQKEFLKKIIEELRKLIMRDKEKLSEQMDELIKKLATEKKTESDLKSEVLKIFSDKLIDFEEVSKTLTELADGQTSKFAEERKFKKEIMQQVKENKLELFSNKEFFGSQVAKLQGELASYGESVSKMMQEHSHKVDFNVEHISKMSEAETINLTQQFQVLQQSVRSLAEAVQHLNPFFSLFKSMQEMSQNAGIVFDQNQKIIKQNQRNNINSHIEDIERQLQQSVKIEGENDGLTFGPGAAVRQPQAASQGK